MISLRPYQQASIDAVMDYWREGGGNPLVDMATGLGKSVVIAKMVRDLTESYPAMRVLMLVHSRELVAQNHMALMRLWPEAPAGIYSAGLNRRDSHHRITFASIQSVYRKARELGPRHLVLIDECFPAGTPISTPTGVRCIEDLRCGDVVLNANGSGTVTATREKQSSDLWDVELTDGTVIACTGNHPFFCETGFVPARELEVGRRVFRVQDLRALQESFSPLDEDGRGGLGCCGDEAGNVGEAAFLLKILRQEAGEPDGQFGSAGEDGRHASEDWSQATDPRRQREADAQGAGRNVGGSGRRMDCRAGDPDQNTEGERIPHLLQSGPGQSDPDDCNRVGWELSPRSPPVAGQKEGRPADLVRVARVARSEHKIPRTVFNLQVSGHPSYFAHGILVHNCHMIPHAGSGMYRKLLSDLRAEVPDLRCAGLSATPYRMDSGRLDEGDGRLFDQVVYSYGVGAGIEDGWLSPLVSKAGAVEIDVSGVGSRGGEFIPGALEQAADNDALTRAAVADMLAKAGDRKSWLVFCAGVKHAGHVRDALRFAGISAECVTGDTPAGDRDHFIREFKAGRLRALTSMGVLTTGFDAPNVDMIAMLRPTRSAGLYVQVIGRGTRLCEGKQNCLVLDYSGNVRRFGPVDQIEVESKTKGAGAMRVEADRVMAKECPQCQSLAHLSARQCADCGYEWPITVEHDTRADDAPILSRDAPKPKAEALDVAHWSAGIHKKEGSPDSVRVEYLAGLMSYREWIMPAHGGYPGRKALDWWRKHGGQLPVPATADEAIVRWSELTRPSTITVRPSGKWFEITGRSFGPQEQAA